MAGPCFLYRVVSIDKNSPLGTGSYGAVYKAKCDELECAAKVIHEALIINDPLNFHDEDEGRIVERFHQECHFLSELKHPNIVQYLGTHSEKPALGRPSVVLLMELMDESLTHHLEHLPNPLPFHIEIDICSDIALALAYLHANHIIHRDLTGNNVLLFAGKRAKVTDFGVSKFIDPNMLQHSSMSLCPGTQVYMPPEALEELRSPHYTVKLDCFSYGVLCIQIFTREFPKPAPRYEEINSPDTRQRIRGVVSENVRRKNHINMVNPDHSLLPTVLECLKDEERERPSSQELCHRLTLLKSETQYLESREHNTSNGETHDRTNGAHRCTVRRFERELENFRNRCDQLRTELESVQDDHRREITIKNNLIEQQSTRIANFEQDRYHKEQEHQLTEQGLRDEQRRCEGLRSQLSSLDQLLQEKNLNIQMLQNQVEELSQDVSLKSRLLREFQERKESFVKLELTWREGPNACVDLRREPDAVREGDMIYFKYFWGKSVYRYNIADESWWELPSCPVSSFSMAVLDNLLTVIGGKNSDLNPVNTLLSFSHKKWTSVFPSMQVARYWTISAHWECFLIVMGGEGRERKLLDDVEILNLETRQWNSVSSLPRPMDSATAAICGDHLYIGGGSQVGTSRYVVVCSLPNLLATVATPSTIREVSKERTWKQIDDFPLLKTALVSAKDFIFAVGGKDDSDLPSSAVYVFSAINDQWEKISDMKYARSSCFAISLPKNEIMVVGGINKQIEPEKTTIRLIEIALVKEQ